MSKKFFKICLLLCLCLVVTAFFLSVLLVKSRQDIILVGQKLSELEKNVSIYTAKNAELDAKILKLSSAKSLHALMSEKLVVADTKNVVKIPQTEFSFYAMERSGGKFAEKRAANNSQKQTNLNHN